MDGIEHVHECVGCWTDDGVWQVSPGNPIVRCKECVHMINNTSVECGCICTGFGFTIPDPDGFCAWGETEKGKQ